ncbi:MAG: hypothetical protein IPJ62_09420 [Betaproteobacteria bacterium]|nr:hypothetical protein [Betaproteobacteria bacterium]
MNATRFRAILAELIDENPFAIRAVLRILSVEFTTAVPTLAVTCEEHPRLWSTSTSSRRTAAATPRSKHCSATSSSTSCCATPRRGSRSHTPGTWPWTR